MNSLKKINVIKKLQLILSVVIIIPVALVYGLFPKKILPQLFGFTATQTDLANIFHALMGLYLAMSIFWVIGIIKPAYWRAATICNIVFMGGLASGRLISMAVDGAPSVYFTAGFFVELLLAVWGMINLYKTNKEF